MRIDFKNMGEKIGNIAEKTKGMVTSSTDKVMTVIDANGDGNIDIEDIIILWLKTPGIGINRRDFLTKEFSNKYTKEVIEKAIETTPSNAGISLDDINKIVDNVIVFERNCVTGISAALGTPGRAAMIATIPADIIQYYGYMLRAAQKLMYLYGFPEIDVDEKGQTFDTETLQNTMLSNPNYITTDEDNIIIDSIEYNIEEK